MELFSTEDNFCKQKYFFSTEKRSFLSEGGTVSIENETNGS